MIKIPYEEGEIIKQSKTITNEYNGKIDLDIFRNKIVDHYIEKQSGIFIILLEGQKLLEVFKTIINERLVKQLNYQKMSLPKISPVDTFRKANILRKWDDYLEKVIPYSTTKGVNESYILDPLQCTSLYQYLENKNLDM